MNASQDQHPQQPEPAGRHFEPDLRSMTRINLRPIASPMPLGFFAVAIASVIVGSLQLGFFGDDAHRAVALTILPAFVLQFLVSILAFGARDVLAATLMACFSGTWLASSLVLAVNPPGGAEVLGVLNLVFACFALLMASVARRKRALWFVLCVAVPRFAVAALYNLTGAEWLAYVSGAFGLLLAAVATYAAFALMLEDMRGEQVLPIGRSGPAHAAVEGDLTVQLRDLERQAGVRRTL
ncbi:GPR1/FUN34/YaaH family transporter [Streptomyces sp. NBC_01803]|uniref:GPR1/FUN34/YaaH family transporter n=1 Tax=Streptomyces sp. NBC_01803 TaxID=2975946 RepID=UPI002DD9AA6E|nr:GPR1/FUN34/YaaH family transporter [Streptomyces sp. NBC_01803]WSA43633.1 GPR1/FUN34/YaaH family transporter [Streptomyces sp. NBC_01803]